MTELPEPTINLFVYGTLKESDTRQKVLGHTNGGVPAEVPGFVTRPVLIEGQTYPSAVPGNGSLEGLVIDVTEKELMILDVYETDSYKRVCAVTTDGEKVQLYIRN